jgi:amidase
LAASSRRASPDFGPVDEVFMAFRSQQFLVDRELQLQQHRDKIKPDIIWNTELGLKQTTSQLAWAERERAALFRRMVEFFQKYDLLVTPARRPLPSTSTCAPATINGKKLDNYMSGSTLNSAITVPAARPSPCPAASTIRPPGRPAARRQAARRGGAAAGRRALRKAVGSRQAPAYRSQTGKVPPPA